MQNYTVHITVAACGTITTIVVDGGITASTCAVVAGIGQAVVATQSSMPHIIADVDGTTTITAEELGIIVSLCDVEVGIICSGTGAESM